MLCGTFELCTVVRGAQFIFSEIFPLRCWCVVITCENVFVLQSTDLRVWVLFCLHYMLILLVDCYTCVMV